MPLPGPFGGYFERVDDDCISGGGDEEVMIWQPSCEYVLRSGVSVKVIVKDVVASSSLVATPPRWRPSGVECGDGVGIPTFPLGRGDDGG